MKKIVLTGGGSAGHCIPNIALLPYLKENYEIAYIGSKNGIEKKLIEKENIPYYEINPIKLQRKITLKNITIPYLLFKSILESKKILKSINPNIVFSKGGYVSLPVVIASHLLKIPVISHESDLSVGLSNKISSNFSDLVLTTFKTTKPTLKNGKYVGPILRNKSSYDSKQRLLEEFNFKEKKPILLITGGSLGAKTINDCVYKCFNELTKKYNLIHICGKGNLNNLKSESYRQYEFLDIYKAYSVCDFALSRAGSNTLFELIYFNIPSLIIPLPKDNSRGDQILNANYFKDKKIFNVLEQGCLDKNSLLNNLELTYKRKSFYVKKMQQENIENSCKKIIEIINEHALP